MDDNVHLKKTIKDRIHSLSELIEACEKVDATMSDETLLSTLAHIDLALETFEKGFVNDACDEIERQIKPN